MSYIEHESLLLKDSEHRQMLKTLFEVQTFLTMLDRRGISILCSSYPEDIRKMVNKTIEEITME
ncbi:hypothetical protein [uncultured Arcobacter sp.]|uniref:hypothetical protein n=1 Tax=uncultured Arcobacter sp. TaxID=165434 RepID=UPI0026179846|nr:hypothetical protein [uncultured Arcobacter sp.]